MRISRAIAAGALIGASLTASAAMADDRDQIDYIESLKGCQGITADDARLACLDAAVATIVSANDQGEVRILDSEDVKQTRRRLFGFSLPDLNLFGRDDHEEDELDMLESTITSVRYMGGDSFIFRIADGNAKWEVNNAPSRLREVEVGDKVVFKKASLGSYFVRIDGQLGVKGHRVE